MLSSREISAKGTNWMCAFMSNSGIHIPCDAWKCQTLHETHVVSTLDPATLSTSSMPHTGPYLPRWLSWAEWWWLLLRYLHAGAVGLLWIPSCPSPPKGNGPLGQLFWLLQEFACGKKHEKVCQWQRAVADFISHWESSRGKAGYQFSKSIESESENDVQEFIFPI